MYEIQMKRAYLDKSFRACPAYSTEQPYADHCTFTSRKEAEKYMVKMINRHRDMAEFRIVKFDVQG